MDIFIGANRSIDRHVLHEVSNSLSTISDLYKRTEYGAINIWTNRAHRGEVVCINNGSFQILFDGYIHNISGSLDDHLPIIARRVIEHGAVLQGKETGIFNIAIIDKANGNFYLTSDPSALLPFYYIHNQNIFYICSHMQITAKALRLSPDYVGVLTKLQMGYTFGSRTLYQSMFRVNPGEIVEFDQGKNRIEIKQSEVYYTDYSYDRKEIKERVWDSLNQPFQALRPKIQKLGMMLSEGFDSRLVSGIAAKNGLKISTYTQGTSGTIGTNVSFSVADCIGADYHFDGLSEGLPSDELEITHQLYLADNLSLPAWINGARYFSNSTVDAVSTGYALDSTFGGHPFYRPTWPWYKAVSQRYQEIIQQDLNLLSQQYVEKLSIELLDLFRNQFMPDAIAGSIKQSLNKDIGEELIKQRECVIEDYQKELSRLSRTGSRLESLVLQRMFMENRARKFSFGQELTIRTANKIVVPSYEPLTMRTLSRIHPIHKLHHKLYLSTANMYLTNLFNIPNGGYGLPGNLPRILLETSRFIHKWQEQRFTRMFLESKGTLDVRNLRNTNYFEVTHRNGKALDFFASYIEKNKMLFNSEQIGHQILKIKDYQSKSYRLSYYYRLFEIRDALARL